MMHLFKICIYYIIIYIFSLLLAHELFIKIQIYLILYKENINNILK